jgi:hypothetical protein
MLETARDQSSPRVQQISFFLPNKVGSLQRVIDVLTEADVRVCGLSILDAHDHAVVRMVVDRPAKAIEKIGAGGRSVCTTQLLGVVVPGDHEGINKLLNGLLRAELNVHYAYSLLIRHRGASILVLRADDLDTGAQILRSVGFELIEQNDLEQLGS